MPRDEFGNECTDVSSFKRVMFSDVSDVVYTIPTNLLFDDTPPISLAPLANLTTSQDIDHVKTFLGEQI